MKYFHSAILAMVALCCLVQPARAGENDVSFPYGGEFVISSEFKYLGSIPYPDPVVDANSGERKTSQPYATNVWKTFARITADSTDIQEVVGVRIYSLPSKWYMKDQGVKPARYYKLNIEKDVDLVSLLKNTGKTPSTNYVCGEFYSIVYDSGGRSIAYCVSSGIVAAGRGVRNAIAERFVKVVANVSSGDKYSQPSMPVPDKAEILPPEVDAIGLSQGKSVAITYSKNLKKLFYGRSMKSGLDAHELTLAKCNSNDCRSTYITNDSGCVAFAFGPTGAWGKARGNTLDEARASAKRYCEMYSLDGGCSVIGELCPD